MINSGFVSIKALLRQGSVQNRRIMKKGLLMKTAREMVKQKEKKKRKKPTLL